MKGMTKGIYDRYLEAEVLSADPVKLVRLLYRGAIDAVQAAQRHLAAGRIRERSRAINRAWGILRELAGSLDHAQGGEISQRLAALYAYMQSRLIEGNIKQATEPLQEVETLLTTLHEAWQATNASAASGEPTAPTKKEVAALVMG